MAQTPLLPERPLPIRPGAWRPWAFAAVAACFFVQGALVWSDWGKNPGSTVAISPLARRGQTIFRDIRIDP